MTTSSTVYRTETTWASSVLSLLRLMAGLFLLQHGMQKFFGFPPYPAGAAAPPVGALPWFAGIIELVCGALIAVGLFTRPAAFLASGMTAVAFFLVHFPRSVFPLLNGGELAALYCFVFFYIAFAGAGPYSVDAILRRDGKLPAWV